MGEVVMRRKSQEEIQYIIYNSRRYKERSELALQVDSDNNNLYTIVKNRADATKIPYDETKISKDAAYILLEGDLEVVIFDDRGRIKITNFIIV